MYKANYFPPNDWRPAALGFGSGCVAALTFLFLSTLSGGRRRIQEAYVAYAIAQDAPPVLQYTLMFVGLVAFFAAVGSLAGA
jgi:hypothetical protein